MKITEWQDFKKGDIINKGFRIERIQLKIDEKYFIDNFIENIKDHLNVLNDIDKIILGDSDPIALFPKNDNDYFDNTVNFLDNMKDNDINVIYISMMEDNNELLNTKIFDDTVHEIKLFSKLKIRYFLKED